MKFYKRQGVIVIAVLLVFFVFAGAIFFVFGSSGRELRKQLDLGRKYLNELNYEQAIDSFAKAIEIDPMNAEAFGGMSDACIGMADTYIEKEDWGNAKTVLEDAIKLFEEKEQDASDLKIKYELVRKELDKIAANEAATIQEPETSKISEESNKGPISIKQVDIIFPDNLHSVSLSRDHYILGCNTDDGGTEIFVYNYDGKLVRTAEYAYDGVSTKYLCLPGEVNGKIYICVLGVENYAENNETAVIDIDNHVIWKADPEKWPDLVCLDYFDNGGYFAVELYHDPDEEPIYVNTKTNEVVQRQTGPDALSANIEYDTDKWGVCEKDENSEYYLVSKKDGLGWGYLDSDMNELAMYAADASTFTESGYAVVSDDGEVYSIIDKDFNVVAENAIKGTGASYMYDCGNIIKVDQAGDNNYHLYFIE